MTSLPNPGQVRLGIIGFGAQGSMYAKFIADGLVPNMVVGAVADTDPERRRQASELYDVPVHTDYGSLLAAGEVDAVITTVPHYLHPEIGIAALEAGIHALVEKPAGVYTRQVAELNACATAHPELTFGIMFNQRNNPLYRRIKEIVDAGEIGAIRRTSWIITTWWRPQGYYDQSAWRATWGGEGGGVLVNQAPHQLDLWQWICGVPQSVYAKVAYGFRRDIAVEDEVTAVVDYGNGATGTFVTAVHDLVGTDRFEILGDKGKIVVDGSKTATVTRLVADEREISDSMGMDEVRQLLRTTEGIVLADEPLNDSYPMPLHAAGRDDVFVGRLRRDETQPRTLNLWTVPDRLRDRPTRSCRRRRGRRRVCARSRTGGQP
jgi:predicted dehydrogenase